jgi:hypothetical protein
MADGASPILAEVMATMSIAVDIGMGQPMEQGLGVCLLAVRFGELVGLGGDELQGVFEVALLRHIGCTAEAADFASIMGDELLARATGGPFVDWANPSEALRFLLGHGGCPYPAHLHQDRSLDPGWRHHVRHAARPGVVKIGENSL